MWDLPYGTFQNKLCMSKASVSSLEHLTDAMGLFCLLTLQNILTQISGGLPMPYAVLAAQGQGELQLGQAIANGTFIAGY
jgi:hypothetical protein